jgi:hypothetical protein
MSPQDMLTLLEKLSGGALPGDVEWTLQDWEKQHSQVALREGLVLSLGEDRRYLAETKPLSRLIRRTLAPGVYLLGEGTETRQEVLHALEKAGALIVALPRDPSPQSRIDSGFRPLPRGSREPGILSPSSGKAPPREESEEASGKMKKRFREALGKKNLSPHEREELAARIERRLVLSEAQLEGTGIRYEKREARGLDYAGKALIVRQAITGRSLLDVTYPGPGGKTLRKFGRPEPLEKREGETYLVLKSEDGEIERIPISKIRLIRRVKESIFGE